MPSGYYIGTESELNAVNDQINSNCGWPCGNITGWSIPIETEVSGVYAIPIPSDNGSHGFTKAEMTTGVTAATSTDVSFPNPD